MPVLGDTTYELERDVLPQPVEPRERHHRRLRRRRHHHQRRRRPDALGERRVRDRGEQRARPTVAFTSPCRPPAPRRSRSTTTTADGTATARQRLPNQLAASINFLAGRRPSQTVTVPVYGDTTYEPNETFFVNLSNPASATIADGQGVGTILNDDPAPPHHDQRRDRDRGQQRHRPGHVHRHPVGRQHPDRHRVTTPRANGTRDRRTSTTPHASGTLTFAPGETTKTVTVDVLGDTAVEGNETFYREPVRARRTPPSPTATGVGTHHRTTTSAAEPAITAATRHRGRTRARRQATFTLTLSQAASRAGHGELRDHGRRPPRPGPTTPPRAASLTFAPGETTKTVTVAVIGDTIDEPNETFTLTLSNLTNVGDRRPGPGVATITDDDTATMSINDVTVTEGNSGTTTATFTVTLSTAEQHDRHGELRDRGRRPPSGSPTTTPTAASRCRSPRARRPRRSPSRSTATPRRRRTRRSS